MVHILVTGHFQTESKQGRLTLEKQDFECKIFYFYHFNTYGL